MELSNSSIDEQIEKIKNDESLPEKTKQRRIELWNEMRPGKEPETTDVKGDIERWSKGQLTTSGKRTAPSQLKSESPADDIKKWAESHTQNGK